MSINLPALALSGAAAAGFSVLQGVFSTSPQRMMLWDGFDADGTPQLDAAGNPIEHALFPQVVLEERSHDALRITEHPVEQGAAVADHAYKMPAQLQLRAGWAFGGNNGPGNNSLISTISGVFSSIIPRATDTNELRKLYAVLLSVQTNRALVTLVTGKRRYQNMMLESLGVTTDEKTENVLLFTAVFREVILAQTHIVVVPSAASMKTPQLNAATQDQGQTTLLSGGRVNAAAANAALPLPLQL